jgi:signal recognition particle subunit SRP19
MEIRDVLMTAGYQPIVENKQYPRERSHELEFRGRIRIQLRNDDGSPHIDNFPTRDSILVYLGEMIPKLKSRQVKPGGGAGGGQENQSGNTAGAAGGGGGGGGGGKKNKKKK